MGLEILLKPLKAIDNAVLRKYSKFANNYEKKGKDIDSLTYKIGLTSAVLGCIGLGAFLKFNDMSNYFLETAIPYSAYAAIELGDDFFRKSGLTNTNIRKDSDTAIDPVDYFISKWHKATRLPALLTGLGLVGKGIFDMYNYFTGGPAPDGVSISSIILGAGIIGQASSQYLKGRDPKLLEKDPVWKRAYNWIGEKIESLAPQPEPQTVPIPINHHYAI